MPTSRAPTVVRRRTQLLSHRLRDRGTQRRILRRHLAREERDDLAVLADHVLAEVPGRQVAAGAEVGVDRRLIGAGLGHHLLEHREGHVVGQLAEGRDLLRAPWLLTAEVVAREAEDVECLALHLALELLQPLVLRGEAALARDVDDEAHLAAVLAEIRRLAVEGVRLHVVKRAHGPSRTLLGDHDRRQRGGGSQQGRQTDRSSHHASLLRAGPSGIVPWTRRPGNWIPRMLRQVTGVRLQADGQIRSRYYGRMASSALPCFDDVRSAAQQIAGVVHRTAVVSSRSVDERVAARVFFKCENLQRAGAFKFRGAYNALSRLSDEERQRGVLAF